MPNILITGGAGFVGCHLARRLAAEPGSRVVLVDNFVRGRLDDELSEVAARDNVEMVSADLTDPRAYERLGDGYDEVYHLAAIIGVENVLRRPHEVVRVNAVATLHLLDWFIGGGGRKLLFSSTSEAYAWTAGFHTLSVPTPEDVPLALTDLSNPRSSYAGSKIFGELAVAQYCGVYQKPFAIVRYHNVYGPRMGHQHVIPQLHQRIVAGEDPLVVYSVDHSRAFCHVEDAVAATVLAMREPAGDGGTFNVGNDAEEITIGSLAERMLKITGRRAAIQPAAAGNDPIARRCPDIGRARRELGYVPQVSLDDGLRQTLAWYAGHRRAAA